MRELTGFGRSGNRDVKTAGVVVVSVAEHNRIEVFERPVQDACVVFQSAALPGIKEDTGSLDFESDGKAVFPK